MKRTQLGRQLRRLMTLAQFANENNLKTNDVLELEKRELEKIMQRRDFIRGTAKMAAGVAALTALSPFDKAFAKTLSSQKSIAIVGAGLAGLTCAYELKKLGIAVTVYEASNRVGGRQYSLKDKFPGQVVERGGELIDNLHKVMLGYAQEFNLEIEDVNKNPGEVFYYFNGQQYAEAVVVDEFRNFVAALQSDLRNLSAEVTYSNNTAADRAMDNTTLLDYLNGKNALGLPAGPIVKEAILQTYIAEYGLAADQQSALNFLLFIHADRRSKFTPFGIYSDERYHIVEGNQAIANGMAAKISSQIQTGHKLERVRLNSAGRYELSFATGNSSVLKAHDIVLLTIPFTTLRDVSLDANLGLSAPKRNAINSLGYGMNAKMMVGFNGRPWTDLGGNGASYSNLPNHQTTWESNWTKATNSHAVLTDYSSAARGLNLNPSKLQTECDRFLTDLDKVFPGAKDKATKVNGQYLAHIEHWPSNPLSKGSYTCYKPGQFTTIAGIEGEPCGNLLFAGEHTNSFYEWQGFMEGACLSGLQALSDIVKRA